MDIENLKQSFRERFGRDGQLYFSPGRINLIGEHTDYNCGFVFPGAVDKGITAEIAANGTSKVRLLALDCEKDGYAVFDLAAAQKPSQHWACYIFGVCMEIARRGFSLQGFDAAFFGTVPFGAGMSSSAALESTFAFALNDMFCDNAIERMELARIGQATEHNYCGVKCGIMDQFASVMGRKGSLIRLDCRSMEYEYFPFHPQGYRLVLLDSCVKHMLGNEYNERRASCEKAVAMMQARWPQVQSLRDADHSMLEAVRDLITEDDFLRAKYILDEKERVLAVCDALVRDDYETVGLKMYETHWGMSREFTASCPETDWLVKSAKECGVSGSRIMGGGFGGCTINLVSDDKYDSFIEKVCRGYRDRFGIDPKVYDVTIGDGSRRLS